MDVRATLAVLLAGAAATACSGPQAHASGQAWQQNQCNKIIDMQERERCMAPTRESYDSYQRQANDVKKSGSAE